MKYVTVVYAIEDEEAFKPMMQNIKTQMSEFVSEDNNIVCSIPIKIDRFLAVFRYGGR